MMTEADYLGLTKRDSRQFKFWRQRGDATFEFTPENPRLHFANRDVDTLEVTVPEGFLVKNDKVIVKYYAASTSGVTVFRGTLEKRVRHKSRGDTASETCTISGPWSKMQRLVYRQNWFNYKDNNFEYSSRLILNQTQSGAKQSISSELSEILSHGATQCGYQVGTINVGGQYLPFDECRDITVADAVRRELRFFPKSIVKFDYSPTTPKISITRPSGTTDAAYVAEIPKTSREYTYTEHPITGVDLEIETVGETDGVKYRNIDHQTAGDTAAGNPDCLYATLHLAGASSSTVRQSFDSKTEDIPTNLNDVSWWQQKHPRIATIDPKAITITEGARSGAADAAKYPRISAASAGELEAAGLKCRTEKFTCKATITTATDEEEDLELTMFFVTTNAQTKKYTWTVSSEATSGETVPSGLAQAILADRSGELLQERMMIRLGSTLPTLGDMCDGLILQAFDVDCGDLTADLSFGQPEHLSPEDMASLLSGFRNKRTSTCSTSRSTGKKSDDSKDEVELGGIPPVSSSEFCPGTKKKTTISAKNNSTGKISLDSSKVEAGKMIDVKELKVGGTKVTNLLAGDNVDITQLALIQGPGILIEQTTVDGKKALKISATDAQSTTSTFSGEFDVVGYVGYDDGGAYLDRKVCKLIIENGVVKDFQVPELLDHYHSAVQES